MKSSVIILVSLQISPVTLLLTPRTMTAQVLLRDTIELSASQCFPSLHNSVDNTKRYAMYIPQSFFESARKILVEADAASTWEFPASICPSESIAIASEITSSPPSTPAQEIVFRYRAGMVVHFEGDGPRSDIPVDDGANTDGGSSAVFYSPVEGPEYPPADALMAGITKTEIKFPHGESSPGWSEPLENQLPQLSKSEVLQSPNGWPVWVLVFRTMVNRMFRPHVHDVREGCMYYSTSHPNLEFDAGRRGRIACSPSPESYENREELQDLSIPRGRPCMSSDFRSMVMHILSKFSRPK